MDIDAYAKILLNQRNSMTPEIIAAIEKQGKLHIICEAKQNRFYELEENTELYLSKVWIYYLSNIPSCEMNCQIKKHVRSRYAQ